MTTTPTEDTRLIPLTHGQCAIVDMDWYEMLSQVKWRASLESGKYYARTSRGRGYSGNGMHRLIMDAPKGTEVDHIDGNGLNNIRANLRLCSRLENGRNRKKQISSKFKYKGIRQGKRMKSYGAVIHVNNKAINLGVYPTIEEAALAYNEGARKYFGEFAFLNVIDKPFKSDEETEE